MAIWKGWENPTGLSHLNAPGREYFELIFRVDDIPGQGSTKPSLDTFVEQLKSELQ